MRSLRKTDLLVLPLDEVTKTLKWTGSSKAKLREFIEQGGKVHKMPFLQTPSVVRRR